MILDRYLLIRKIFETIKDNLLLEVGFEPTCLATEDFESSVYTIPPLEQNNYYIL